MRVIRPLYDLTFHRAPSMVALMEANKKCHSNRCSQQFDGIKSGLDECTQANHGLYLANS